MAVLEMEAVPVDLVVMFVDVYCYTVLFIVSSHCSFLFRYPFLQSSTGFTHLNLVTVPATYILLFSNAMLIAQNYNYHRYCET